MATAALARRPDQIGKRASPASRYTAEIKVE
jgi:hypothetical protein